MAVATKQASPFKRIPNESLEHIISYALEKISAKDPVKCSGENGALRFRTPIVVSLKISHQFRKVTQDPRFWHDVLFAFEDLIPTASHDRSIAPDKFSFPNPISESSSKPRRTGRLNPNKFSSPSLLPILLSDGHTTTPALRKEY